MELNQLLGKEILYNKDGMEKSIELLNPFGNVIGDDPYLYI
jgi:hypothetical protein